MNHIIQSAKTTLSLNKKEPSIKIEVECKNTPYIHIIQRVLRHSYDLVMKAAEKNENKKGFRALDMALLGQCPCAGFR